MAVTGHGPIPNTCETSWWQMFLLHLLPQGLFECCSSTSSGKPEFLEKEKLVTARPATNLQLSSSGSLDLYFQRWESDRRQRVRAVVSRMQITQGECRAMCWKCAWAWTHALRSCCVWIVWYVVFEIVGNMKWFVLWVLLCDAACTVRVRPRPQFRSYRSLGGLF
jgi:hypothetical protein